MKITDVKVFRLRGAQRSGLALYEILRGGLNPNESSPHSGTFTQIETDEGVTGLVQGGSAEIKGMGKSLIGEDPMRIEYIWDRFFSQSYHRIQGLRSISILDVALWDLVGKAKGEPVYKLLGGHCQERIRAYAGMLGFSVDPQLAAERSLEWKEKGFTAFKWYLPYNEEAGEEGLRHSEALVKAVRDAVGDYVDIMVDCILSNSVRNSLLYAIKLARRLEPYNLTWLEEPLNPEDMESYEKLAGSTSVPLAFGERMHGRWQFRAVMERGIVSVIQPEAFMTGGISEMRKIAVLCSVYGIPIIPHANESCRNSIHLLFANPHRICPLGEWGIRINHNSQYFYKDFYEPVKGYFELPKGPGFGYEIDPDKVVDKVEI